MLRHRLDLGAGSVLGEHHRAVVSRFNYPDDGRGDVSPSHMATRMAVAGGASLVTALGRTVADARSAESTILL